MSGPLCGLAFEVGGSLAQVESLLRGKERPWLELLQLKQGTKGSDNSCLSFTALLALRALPLQGSLDDSDKQGREQVSQLGKIVLTAASQGLRRELLGFQEVVAGSKPGSLI